jgi:tripartite-type tricarboxylate transporter receptor subunit TctC
MFDPGPGLQHAAMGKLVLLAVASGKRASRYPDVPTLAELGMNVDADTTFGVYAPAGVSAAIVERMNREINRTLSSPALVENMARLGGEVAPLTIQEFVNRQAADRARYGAFIKEAGIKVD